MAELDIHLQDGFSRNSVLISVNNEKVFSKTNVTTKRILGLADTVSVTVPDDQWPSIHIQVDRDVSQVISVPPSAKMNVGLSLAGNQIRHIISPRAFGYA